MVRITLGVFLAFIFIPAVSAADPLTYEQAKEMALSRVPGVVVDTERSIHNGAVVFEFDIKQENGAVMDIEIDSATREVLRMTVDETGTEGSLPEPDLTQEEARTVAVEYIRKNTSGLRGVDILSEEYTIVNGTLAYLFQLQRGISLYQLAVDANTGRVFQFKEQ